MYVIDDTVNRFGGGPEMTEFFYYQVTTHGDAIAYLAKAGVLAQPAVCLR